MATCGKNINLFLMDGTATGRIKCTLANWTGVAYKIPRTEIDRCKNRGDLKQSGVYFLFGTSDETGEDVVYIGQAGERKNSEGVLYRLQEHQRNEEKGYWTHAVVFVTSNNSFGQTEISYLENKFFTSAKEAKRYVIKNNNMPALGNVTEEKESELNEFIEYAEIIMGALGYNIFESVNPQEVETRSVAIEKTVEEEPLFLKSKRGNAQGKRTREGFLLCKGSLIARHPVASCPGWTMKLREKHKNKLKENSEDTLLLTEDILFKSPSAASGFVGYRSSNGLIEWKDAHGRTLGYLEKNR